MAEEKTQGTPDAAKVEQPAPAVNGEKGVVAHGGTEDLHEYAESEGYIIDVEEGAAGYKLAKDGHTRLIPQPSDDPNDPLNWSWATKHLMLFIVAATAFLPDYGSATGAVTLLSQAECVMSSLVPTMDTSTDRFLRAEYGE